MSRFRFSEKAAEDLEQIDDYLSAEAGDDVAEQVVTRILAACDLLATQPGMGHRREDLTEDDVRFWPVYSYLIVYREGAPLDVVRIWSARQDPRKLALK